MADSESTSKHYAPDAVDLRGIGTGALMILGAIVFAIVAAFATTHVGNADRASTRVAASPGKPPPIAGPVTLQPDPEQDIRQFRTEKQRLLEAYGWVDREHGIARIPIERAMQLLANPPAASGSK
jgi:hypothetical protein